MKIPVEVKEFLSLMDLNLFDATSTEDEIVGFAMKHTSDANWADVKAYINDLLDVRTSDEELQKLWFDSGASLYFHSPSDLRQFLKLITVKLS